MIESPQSIPPTPAQKGSGGLGCVLLLAVWIGGLAFVIYPVVWLAEQFALIGGQSVGRIIWVATVFGHAMAVLLPSIVAQSLKHGEGSRSIFKTWALAGFFALLALPIQVVSPPEAQLAAFAQIIGATFYLIFLAGLRKRAGDQLLPGGKRSWLAPLLAALIVWPWVIWGALGSWLDTVLNLAAALIFGLAVGLTLSQFLFPRTGSSSGHIPLRSGLAGFVASIAMLTMGAAYGYNGQQLILLFLMAAMGWLTVLVGRKDSASDWPEMSLLVGLVVTAPFLLVDPDELNLILNLGSRDVGFYTSLATMIGMGMALLLAIIVWIAARRHARLRREYAYGLAGLAWVGLAALYFIVGQPGWSGERLYVILASQADLSTEAGIVDAEERRVAVYERLVGHADDTQYELRQALERRSIRYQPYYLINALEVDGGPFVRWWLESRPEVDRVLVSPELRPLPALPTQTRGNAAAPQAPEWNLVDIGATQVWEEFGVQGAEIVIGQSDSGVDGHHPELQSQYRGNQASGPPGNTYNWFDPWNNSTAPVDISGHGTHTLGSALGLTVGVAPEAIWIGCVNLARNLGNPPRYLDCLQFMLAPFPQGGDPLRDGRPEVGAHILNNSWGCPEIEGCDPKSLLPAVQNLRVAGVFVVASAGNDGSACSSLDAPISIYDEVFTVGAIDAGGGVAEFSSRGPVTADGSGRTKPDVVAPGVNVLSSFPGSTYAYNSGTSMAGPHVAGVVALLWSAEPALIGNIERTERILIETARPIVEPFESFYCGDPAERPNNTTGYGLVDAYAAVARALDSADQ